MRPGKARSRYWSGSEAPPAPFGQKAWQKKGRRRKRLGGRPARGLSGLISQALGTRMDNTVLRQHTYSKRKGQQPQQLTCKSFVCAARGDKISVNESRSEQRLRRNKQGSWSATRRCLFACFDPVHPWWEGTLCLKQPPTPDWSPYIHFLTRLRVNSALFILF